MSTLGTWMRHAALITVLLLTACGSDSPRDEADAAACDRYEDTVQALQNDEFDHNMEFLAELQRSHELAESERLQEQLGTVLDGARETDMDPAAIARVNSWCGID